ncbi:MAG: hypothetical protein ACPL3P_06650 [Anaerolineales bacterium]
MEQPKRSLPRSVIILAVLQIIQGGGLLSAGIYQAAAHGWDFKQHLGKWMYIPLPLFESLSSAIVLIGLGGLMLIVSLALLKLYHWAWIFSLTLQGLGLLFGLISYLRQRPNYIGMILGILIVFYLNLDEVQNVFHQQEKENL